MFLLTVGSAAANNLVVLPTFISNPTENAIVYTGSPLTQSATFPVSPAAFQVLARATANAADVKYYAISRSGSNSILVLSSTFAPIGQPVHLGQNVTGAALTPNGQRLLVVVSASGPGALRMYNTDTNAEVQAISSLDVGINPEGIAISPDSRRAYVMSAGAQRVTVVDLVNAQVLGQIPLPGLGTGQGSITTGLNGMIYISAGDRVLEVDPRTEASDSSAVRRQFQLPGARVGKLHFTPDGTRALAINTATQTGQLLYYFSLDFRGSSLSSVGTGGDFTGIVFDKIFIGETNRAFITTSPQSSGEPGRLFSVTLPDPPAVPGADLAAPILTPAFFGSLGDAPPRIDSIVFTPEKPNARRMFISAHLNLAQPLTQNVIYTVQLAATPNVTGTTSLNFLPGPIQYVGPASTAATDPPSGILPVNQNQPNITAGGRSLPFGLRVIGVSGQPLFNFPVTFTTTSAGVQIVGSATQSTGADGSVLATIVAPGEPGSITVTATAGNFSAAFSFTVGTSGGGGGGGGGGGTGTGTLKIRSGNGQIVQTGNFSRPIIVEIRDASGSPVANAQVVWTLTQGVGGFLGGSAGELPNQQVTFTSAAGRTEIQVLGGQLSPLTQSFSTGIISIASGGLTAEAYFTSYLLVTNDGTPAIFPGSQLLEPTSDPPSIVGRAGQTLPNAIRVLVSSSAPPNTGSMPGVGISVRVPGVDGAPDNDPTRGPAVECTPEPEALTNEVGVASCNIRLFGRITTGTLMFVNIGGFRDLPVRLRVDPGEPSRLRIVTGDNQSGNANENLPGQFVVVLDDGAGNILAGEAINWSVSPPGAGTLTNSTTVTNTQGQALVGLRLGAVPGDIEIRATALRGSQPTVTFRARISVQLGALQKVSGDPQTAFTNANFGAPLVVRLLDNRQPPVPISGQVITFTVASGSAILTSNTAVTDANGQAVVQVRAGAVAGPVAINAAVQGLPGVVSFNLNVQLPGPLINALDFFNAASGERGAVVPGSLYYLAGRGVADGLAGCLTSDQAQPGLLGGWPTRLRNVEIQFGAVLAPILNVCNIGGREWVTFQAPFELAPGGGVTVTVRVGTGSTVVNGVQVLDLQPGIFETVDTQNRRYAVALRPNGSYVTPINPARYGEVIRVFITGAGLYSPAALTGVTGIPNQNVIAPVVVGLNNAGVRLISATYWEGAIGIAMIAFEVPQGTPIGTAPLGVLLTRPNGQFVFPGNSPTIEIAQ